MATLQQILEEPAIECDWDEMTHAHWCEIEVGLKLQINIYILLLRFLSKLEKLKLHPVTIAAKEKLCEYVFILQTYYSLHK